MRAVSSVVADMEGPKGLAFVDELDGSYGSEIDHGRLSPHLDTPIVEGFVDKSGKDDRTNDYSLSNRGAGEMSVRREWEAEFGGELD